MMRKEIIFALQEILEARELYSADVDKLYLKDFPIVVDWLNFTHFVEKFNSAGVTVGIYENTDGLDFIGFYFIPYNLLDEDVLLEVYKLVEILA